jgi:hypothetical protein
MVGVEDEDLAYSSGLEVLLGPPVSEGFSQFGARMGARNRRKRKARREAI